MAARDTDDQEQLVRRTDVRDQSVRTIEADDVAERSNGRSYPRDAPTTPVVVGGIATRPAEQALVSREVVAVDRVAGRRAQLDRVAHAIWFVASALEAALGFRIAFALLTANPDNGFVSLINRVTDPLVRPFDGIFQNPTASGGATLDSGAVVAMVVCLVLAWALVRLVWLLFDRTETGVRRTVHDKRTDVR